MRTIIKIALLEVTQHFSPCRDILKKTLVFHNYKDVNKIRTFWLNKIFLGKYESAIIFILYK